MFETPKEIKRNHLRDEPTPGKYCDADGCARFTVIYIQAYDVNRCATCYQRDLDNAGGSANQASAALRADD